MSEPTGTRPLAVVTGASSGIGLEIARQLAAEGFDLVVAADEAAIHEAATSLREAGAEVEAVQVDLATADGVEELAAAVADRDVEALVANAGRGVSGAFVDTDLDEHLAVVALNVTGTVRLAHRVVGPMARRGHGRVLVTSSIASGMPGPYQSTYNASKAFLHSFAEGLRVELADAGVTVTSLLPGPTATRFFERAGMEDTMIAKLAVDDPADVARAAVGAMLAGDDQVVTGLVNKLQAAAAAIAPDRLKAALHAKVSKPGSAR